MMKLSYSPTSPYVRKVMVVLHETGQLDDVALVQAATTPVAPAEALKGKAPLGKVPALERDDGRTLYDSRVICAWLDERGEGGAPIGQTTEHAAFSSDVSVGRATLWAGRAVGKLQACNESAPVVGNADGIAAGLAVSGLQWEASSHVASN